MIEVPEVMPGRDYLFTIAEEIMYSVEVSESLINWVSGDEFPLPEGKSQEDFLEAVRNIVRPDDKYFLCKVGLHNGGGSGEHIDAFLYAGRSSKDPNLRHISSEILYPDFLSADAKHKREKWIAALKEVGGKFGFYYGDREFDVVCEGGLTVDSQGLERLVASL